MHFLLAALINWGLVSLNQQALPPAQALCSLAISVPAGHDLWDVADQRFEQGDYIAAARTYYQFFRCGKRGWMPIPSTLVLDYHQLERFDAALRNAAEGNFVTAISGLKQVLRVLPQFGEARFLVGVFQWSEGKHSAAQTTWRTTITAAYFTLPTDTHGPPRVVNEAKKLLRWSTGST